MIVVAIKILSTEYPHNFSVFQARDLGQKQLPDRCPQQTRLGFGFSLTDLLVQKSSAKMGNVMRPALG